MNHHTTESTLSTPSAWTILARLNFLFGLEHRILAIVASYAVVIGLFALIVPLTVQELVNTFAFAIQPIMIVTLVAIMLGALLFMGAFRVLQARAVEILVQRLIHAWPSRLPKPCRNSVRMFFFLNTPIPSLKQNCFHAPWSPCSWTSLMWRSPA